MLTRLFLARTKEKVKYFSDFLTPVQIVNLDCKLGVVVIAFQTVKNNTEKLIAVRKTRNSLY